ncbi:MAG: aminotransferase class V-fold PLP-dependent enzyme [Cyclobacteriaceae bacterium]|nr:aminotransferase class V-fold PLP-dependent enzyme [Cyclobacteriaceae bacterium]
MQKIYFTPGPSQLYFTVEEHLKSALNKNIGSISHRGQQFKDIYQHADKGLRSLLNLPDNFKIIFTSSASEVWERIIQDCVMNSSTHFVNGAFSNKFYQTAVQLGVNPEKIEAEDGSCASLDELKADSQPELISFTHNETSTGAAQPLQDIYAAREKFPEALITVDVVSSLPYVDIDYTKVDSVYFSVQKSFGMPAGLGVWLVNDRCIEAALKKEALRKTISGGFRLTNSYKMAMKYQTPATPNVLGIYLLSKVVEDMNLKGIDMIRRETEYKAALLYHTINESKVLSPFVKDKNYQSKTVIIAQTENNAEIIEPISEKGFILGTGYGKYKNEHIRIANFPTHSKEQVEMLSDFILLA